MNKQEVLEKYKAGFTIDGKHPIETEEWLLDENRSNEDTLIFLGYDANMWPSPDWKKFDENNPWHIKRIKTCRRVTQGFKGNVYMDDICVTDISEV